MILTDFFIGLLAAGVIVLAVTAVLNLWTGVPSLPTGSRVTRAMVSIAGLRGTETVFDLGAGDARILLEAKRRFPGLTARGWEIVPTMWLLGKLHIFLRRETIDLQWGSFLRADLSSADCIFLYLFPELLRSLEEKFRRELKPGTILVSHTFPFPGRKPLEERTITTLTGAHVIRKYVW